MMRQAVFLFFFILLAGSAAAQDALSALARLDGRGVQMDEVGADLVLTIDMTQSLPWRVFTLDAPERLVLDFSELDWTGARADILERSDAVEAVRMGLFRPGWSRIVLTLDGPYAVQSAGMAARGQGARVEVVVSPTDAQTFAQSAGAPPEARFAVVPPPVVRADGPLVVVLDPGHGGIDPGAEYEDIREAELMLTFARELQELFLRQDNVDVVLTRTEDVFVPLETRVSIARGAGADVFLSLHADALAQGRALGASVYTLSDEASDIASQLLAERHDREDLLAGVDLTTAEDEVALVLMDLARTETKPRTNRLADMIVDGIRDRTGATYKTPRMEAGFSVLKAPDIPSVLIELGFLTSKRDRENMTNPAWRQKAAEGIRDAVLAWAEEDAAIRARLRQ